MSWQWVPAQLDAEYRDPIDPFYNRYNGFRPGYYVGLSAEAGLYMVNGSGYANLPSSMSGDWIITNKPFPQFTASAMTSADEVVGTYTFAFNNNSEAEWTQVVYFGKPVYSGYDYVMKYSPSENVYIIVDADKRCVEPIYSTDLLSGGISGDWFWKSGAQRIRMGTGPVTFNLAGAQDRYKEWEGEDYIDHFIVSSDFEYYAYSSPSAISAYDEYPAGEYTNNKTGEQITVGTKTYKGTNPFGGESFWKGHQLKSTRTGSRAPYYQSAIYGQIRYFSDDSRWGPCWRTPGSKPSPVYVYNDGALSALPPSFTLSYYEWNDELTAYQAVTSNDIDMELGPYQLVSADNTILMGEVSIWR